MTTVVQGLVMGAIATVLMDVWSLFAKRALAFPTTDWALVGRWVGYLRHGQFTHASIQEAAPVAAERLIGWMTHYAIGLVYGVAYLLLMSAAGRPPGLFSAIAFGLLMLAAPWLVLLPGLGLGIAARRAPRPWLARGTSFSMHFVFGIGLYLGWQLLAAAALAAP